MDWTIYGALIAGFLALAAASAHLVLRFLETLRSFKRFNRRLARSVAELADATERAAVSAERAGDTALLEASLARLSASLTQLAVLREALDEASETFARLTAVVPRK